MLLSRSLNSLILGCGLVPGLLALAACDRQGSQPAQGESAGAASASGTPAAASAAPAKGADRTHKGTPLPPLTLADPAGRKLLLADLAGQSGGRPVLINLWATWCAPCVKELPTLEALAAAGKIRVVTVSQDSGEPAKVAAFLKDKGITHLEPWLDPDNALAFHLNGGTLPMSVLYSPAGREIWRFSGEQDWTAPAATALLAEAL